MDNPFKNRIIEIVITFLLSGAGGYLLQEPGVVKITRESEQRNAKIVSLQKEINDLQSRYVNLDNGYIELKKSYDSLNTLYQKCISSQGAIYRVPSLDFTNTYTKEFKTGDIIEFELTSTPIEIMIKRISKDGPVITVNGCEYYLTENEISSAAEGRHTYYLSPENPFILKYSTKSCKEGNASMIDSEIEEIFLQVLVYNLDEQKTTIKYHRTLYQ